MRQICPHCQKAVEVPEAAAGGDHDCPACGEPFPVPRAYTPTVVAPPEPEPPAALVSQPGAYAPGSPKADRPPPPPGYVPPSPQTVPSAAAEVGEVRSRGVALAPGFVGWVPVAGLTVCLVLSFVPWVGAYPGGYRVFSQHPWEAGLGDVNATGTAVPPALQEAEPELARLAPVNLFMLLYGVLLVVTVILAWVERVVTGQPDVLSVPGPLGWLPAVWPYRFALLLGLTGLLLFLAGFQAWRGFGLETAVQRYAAARHDEAVKAADTKAKEQVAQIQIGMDAARFAVRPTVVRDVAIVTHVLVVLGLLARVWLARRGGKPPPRLVVQY